jgi:hypothetical protein
VYYDSALPKFLQNWQSRVQTGALPYTMFCIRDAVCDFPLSLSSLQGFLNQRFLVDSILRYRVLLLRNSTADRSLPSLLNEKMQFLVGEYAEIVLDILSEGACLNTDFIEIPGVAIGELIVHITLLEELKSARASVLEALLELTSGLKERTVSTDTKENFGKRTRDRGHSGVKGLFCETEKEALLSVQTAIYSDLLTQIFAAATSKIKYQIITTPRIPCKNMTEITNSEGLDNLSSSDATTADVTISTTGMLRSRVQNILTPHTLPLPPGHPSSKYYPLLVDPNMKYLTSTTSFPTSFANMVRVSEIPLEPEKYLVNIFRSRFFRSSNRKRDLPSAFLCGALHRRKLERTETDVVRSYCTSTVGEHLQGFLSYTPQVRPSALLCECVCECVCLFVCVSVCVCLCV